MNSFVCRRRFIMHVDNIVECMAIRIRITNDSKQSSQRKSSANNSWEINMSIRENTWERFFFRLFSNHYHSHCLHTSHAPHMPHITSNIPMQKANSDQNLQPIKSLGDFIPFNGSPKLPKFSISSLHAVFFYICSMIIIL